MTSIRKRNSKYQVQIRIQRKNLTKTFSNLKDARKWGSHYENKIHLGSDLETLDKNIILADLINKYLKEITPTKKGWHMENIRMKRLLRQSISKRPVYLLKTKDFVEYKNERIKDGKIACRYDLTLLHHMYNVAIKQWSYPILSNPKLPTHVTLAQWFGSGYLEGQFEFRTCVFFIFSLLIIFIFFLIYSPSMINYYR